MLPLVIAVTVLAPLLAMAWIIDDWSRDLTTNTAATSPDHADERLRPIELAATVNAATKAVTQFAQSNAAWRLAEEKPLPNDSPLPDAAGETSTVHHMVRTTGLMRYRDDVWLVVEDLGAGKIRLHADSRSRVGKGDLGQNPRNLRELLPAISKRLSQPDEG